MKLAVTSQKKMSFLGLDFGASFIKGAVLDPVSGSVSSIIRVPSPPFLEGLPPGHREIDPAAITRTFWEILEALLKSEPKPEGILLCGQMHGFVLMDDAGHPLSNYHSWQDRRSEEIDPRSGRTFYDTMIEVLSVEDQIALGRERRSGLPSSQLFWMARNDRIPPGARACSLMDFIVAEACGRQPVTEATLASSHGLFDVRAGTWHREVVSKLGLPESLLPEIVPSGTCVGTLDISGRKVPLYTPVGDQQCALAGVGLREQELSLNVATGSQVSLRAKEYRAGPFQVRPYFNGEFLLTVTHIPAGRSLNALVNLFSELVPESKSNAWEKIIEKLQSIPTTTARVDLSFFPGAFGGEGALTQLREENLTVGDLMLAALESMARNYRQAAEQISPQKNWRGIVLSGGLAQKIRRLQVLIRRELPGPLRLPNFPEDTLLGLLILGTSWSGQYGTLQENQERILGQTESSPG